MSTEPISDLQLVLAAGLMLVSALVSWRLRLGLERDITIAGVRMTAQLLLVGLILNWVFALNNPLPVIGVGVVMTALAAHAGAGRSRRRYPRLLLDSFVSIMASSFLVTGLTLRGILNVQPWFLPQYAVPILGMVLGNSMTGVSLAVDRFTSNLDASRDEVEGLLAVGASRWEAAQTPRRDALRTAMIPTLNSMAIMGIASLPGMMTGQILGGASPATAVRYQIVIMFVIASGTALGCLLSVQFAYRSLFDNQHRLRLDQVQTRP